MRKSTTSNPMPDKAVKGSYSARPGGSDGSNIDPGTPFPEPEVKPTIVSSPPAGSQVGDIPEGDRTTTDSSNSTPAS